METVKTGKRKTAGETQASATKYPTGTTGQAMGTDKPGPARMGEHPEVNYYDHNRTGTKRAAPNTGGSAPGIVWGKFSDKKI